MMKVGITAEALNNSGAGIGTYTYNLVEVVLKMLLKMDGTVFLVEQKIQIKLLKKFWSCWVMRN